MSGQPSQSCWASAVPRAVVIGAVVGAVLVGLLAVGLMGLGSGLGRTSRSDWEYHSSWAFAAAVGAVGGGALAGAAAWCVGRVFGPGRSGLVAAAAVAGGVAMLGVARLMFH